MFKLPNFIYSNWKMLWGLCLGLSFGVLVIHPLSENDPFWHMALGRAVLEQGTRIVSEPYAIDGFNSHCVVPEWLWGVVTYKLHQFGSWPAVISLVVMLTILFAVVVVHLLFEFVKNRDGGIQSTMLISLLIVALSLARIRVRPQVLFFLLLVLFLFITVLYVHSEGKKRLSLSVLIVLVEIAWAQFHGSFVIAPVLFLIFVIPRWKNRSSSHQRTTDLIVILFLMAGCLTSAYSLDIARYIFSHAYSDAVYHIVDMHPVKLSRLFSVKTPFEALYLAIVILSLAGMLYSRKIYWREFLLVSFGLMLSMTAVRFISVGGVFWGPLCVRSCCDFFNSRTKKFYATVGLFGLLAICHITVANRIDKMRGPLFHLDSALEKHPHGAVAYFRKQNISEPINVLTDYNSGALLGFALNGQVRTFVDSRTPLFFDDTDFALARDIWSQPEALSNGVAFFNFKAAVVSRHSKTCAMLYDLGWSPVVVEPEYTTFYQSVDEGQYIVASLNPCGDAYFKQEVCSDDGKAIQSDIHYMKELGSTPFLDFTDAFQRFTCKKNVDAAEQIMPEDFQSRAFGSEYARLRARMFFAERRSNEALQVLEPMLDAGDMASWDLLEVAVRNGDFSPSRVEPLYAMADRKMSDAMPVRLRVVHAFLCAELQQPECARFEAIRAAAMGEHKIIPVLTWLSRNHPNPRVRNNAMDWISLLEKQQTKVKKRKPSE